MAAGIWDSLNRDNVTNGIPGHENLVMQRGLGLENSAREFYSVSTSNNL